MNNIRNEPAGTAAHTSGIPTAATDSLDSWLYLHHTADIGATAFQQLLACFGSASAALDASRQQLSGIGLKDSIITALGRDEKPDISADLQWLEQPGHHIITLADETYPAQLKQLSDAPPLLYVRGDPDYLNQPQLAMVGSRNPSAAGRSTAKEFASHLSNRGITITSGLASGIDGASHEGALQGLAGTIAVVAHGLDIVYPAQHQKLAQQICENGAVISEMPIGIQPQRGFFPRRNRLISALSLGTLVVEAALKSGSLITARYALEQNREVFAIPGSIHNPMARGCHQLIRQGAKLVESADDILEELPGSLPGSLQNSLTQETEYPLKPGSPTPENSTDEHNKLDPDHQKLLKCLAYEPASIDELVTRSSFSAAEIASMMLILELEGIVASQDGRYTRVS